MNVPKTLQDFGLEASNLFLYYEDLPGAEHFYCQTLGMELVADYGMARIVRMSLDSYLILVDANAGMHTADEPKTVALALITDQLDQWYEYLTEKGFESRNPYKPKEGSAHDGFVIKDPEGYLLEFERFNDHPENLKFFPVLNAAPTLPSSEGSTVPEGLGFKATVTWMYYKDILEAKAFYENILGLPFIADQGWTKIHQVTSTGFIGLVDEQRGMHNYTEDKAVNISFILSDVEGWFKEVNGHGLFPLRDTILHVGDEGKYKAFVGYDPGAYFLEFDTFYPHELNNQLMDYLSAANE